MANKQRLGEVLVQNGLVSEKEIERALRLQVGGNRRLGYILIRMGLINNEQLLDALSSQLGLSIISIDDEFSDEVKGIIPRYLCLKYSVMPLAKGKNNVLRLAMLDPLDDTAISDIENYTSLVVEPVLASEQDIARSIRRHLSLSVKDIFNPQVFSRLAKVFSMVALVLLLIIGFFVYRNVRIEKYGTVSVAGDSKVFQNHDLMLGVDKDGKISLLGHGAYSKGYFKVTFDNLRTFKIFLEQKRSNFSNKQYDWLFWIIGTKLPADRE